MWRVFPTTGGMEKRFLTKRRNPGTNCGPGGPKRSAPRGNSPRGAYHAYNTWPGNSVEPRGAGPRQRGIVAVAVDAGRFAVLPGLTDQQRPAIVRQQEIHPVHGRELDVGFDHAPQPRPA